MPTNQLEILDQRIEQLRKRLEAAERLRETLADDPDLLSDLLGNGPGKKIGSGHTGAEGARFRRRSSSGPGKIGGGPVATGHFGRIATFLEKSGGQPQAIMTISEETGIPKNSVINLVYRTHAPLFDPHPVEGHKTKRVWTLKKNWKTILRVSEGGSE